MNTWTKPYVEEINVGMEVTSYESADLDGGTIFAVEPI